MTFSNPATMPKPSLSGPINRKRDLLLLGVLFALVIAALVGLAAATGWEETRAQLARVTLFQFVLLLALSLANYGLRGLRWHLFATRLGLKTRLIVNMRHFLGGLAMSVTPGRLGELIRMRWIRRETGWAFEHSAPLVLVDRASDLAAMALLLGTALALSSTGIALGLPVTFGALAVAFLSTRPRLLSWLATRIYQTLGFWPRIFARVRAAARSLAVFSQPMVLVSAMALGGVGWLAEGYAFHLLLGWMGSDIGIGLAVAIFMFSTIAGTMTGAPGGVGGAEAAMIALLSLQGVPLEVSIPATAIIRITTLWFAIAIGLIIFPIAERHSMRGHHGLEI
jgi:uncharacterized protein (TIRG00374 family)